MKKKIQSGQARLVVSDLNMVPERSESGRAIDMIAQIIILFLGVFSLSMILNDFFQQMVSPVLLGIVSTVLAVAVTIATQFKLGVAFVAPCMVTLFLLLCLVYANSFGKLSELFREMFRAIMQSKKPYWGDADAVFLLITVVAFCCAGLFALFFRVHGGLIGIAVVSFAICGPVYFSFNFPSGFSFSCLIVFLAASFAYCIGGKRERRQMISKKRDEQQHRRQRRFAVRGGAMALVVCMVSFMIAGAITPSFSNVAPVAISEFGGNVRNAIMEIFRAKVTGHTALSFGKLGQLDRIVYKDIPVAEISLHNNLPVYLKIWAAGQYKNSQWSNEDGIYDNFFNSVNDPDLKKYLEENMQQFQSFVDVNGFGSNFFKVLEGDGPDFDFKANGFLLNKAKIYPVKLASDETQYATDTYFMIPSIMHQSDFYLNRNYKGLNYDDYMTAYTNGPVEYEAAYVQPSFEDGFGEKLSALQQEYREKMQAVLDDPQAEQTLKVQLKMEQLYSEYVHQVYSVSSADLSDRTRELAKSLQGADLYQTVANIQAYFKDNTSYTNAPGMTPATAEFIDYFLFQSKKGYCTHYATTMVQMLRELGVPTRYVEGYYAQYRERKEESFSSDYHIPVMDSGAHAWIEIYFDGLGWAPIEATPIYDIVVKELPNVSYSDIRYPVSIDDISFDPIDWSNYSEPSTEQSGNNFALAVMIGGALLLAVAVLLSVRSGTVRKQKASFRSADMNAGVIAMYRYLVKLLRIYQIQIKRGEKLLAFAKRVDREFLYAEDQFTDVMRVFLQARFSTHEVSVEQRDFVYQYIERVTQQVVKELPPMKRLLNFLFKTI